MRFIHKDLTDRAIPVSLRYPRAENFEDGKVDRKANTTHDKRKELVAKGKFDDAFVDRYKQDDVRDALERLYHYKCAYCEFTMEQYHVEHYRPKNTYYWLAFSWDNLLLCCPKCNEFKGKAFEVQGSKVSIKNDDDLPENINQLASIYDAIEYPLLIHPEITDVQGLIEFDQSAKPRSEDPRVAHTIILCRLDRAWLNDERKKIWDELVKVLEIVKGYSQPDEKQIAWETIKARFLRDALDPEKTFTAYRRFLLSKLNWK